MIRLAPLEVPAPDSERIAVLLGECATQLSDLLDEELPVDASLPERRRRTQLVNRIRMTLASTGLLIGLDAVFDSPARATGARR